MKRHIYYLVALQAVIVFLIFPVKNTNAIPAFARKYQISCQVCHSPAFPHLKPFGVEFENNGFRMTKYESPRYFIPTGDEKLSLLRELPLAIRLDGFASYNFENQGKTDFTAPYVLKIISGGEISDKISYYFYFLYNELGAVGGVEDAFIKYHDMFKSGINFIAGQFRASDPMFPSELRYTVEPYRIYDVSPGNSSASLSYERGIMFDKGFKTGTTLTAEILNGSGIGEAGEDFLYDKDKYKNFLLRISQSFGKSVTVGLMGYTGKEVLPGLSGPFTSSIQMFGPDLTIDLGEKVIINAQCIVRTDSEVFLEDNNSTVPNVITSGGFAEVIYAPGGDKSKWYLTGLFNRVESDLNYLDYTSATIHAGYLLRRNMRLVSEYTYQFSGNSYGKVNVGIVTAF